MKIRVDDDGVGISYGLFALVISAIGIVGMFILGDKWDSLFYSLQSLNVR